MKHVISCSIAVLALLTFASSPANAATSLELSTPKSAITINQQFTVTVNITSTDNTLGTDVVLNYNPQSLQLESVTPGTIYPNYSKINGQTTAGTVSIIAVSDFSSGVTPSGTFATITFTPLQEGPTEIAFAHNPNATNLTGVIPFEGNTLNLLTQPPSPLSLTITKASPLSALKPPTNLRLPITIAVIISVTVTIFFLMRRKSPIPTNTNQANTTPTTPPTLPQTP